MAEEVHGEQMDVQNTSWLDPNGRLHRLEQAVRDSLLAVPACRFSSLVVRRCDDRVVLEGFMESAGAAPDIASLVRRAHGVTKVVNRLVVTEAPCAVPPKG